MDVFTRARPAQSKRSAATGRGALVPAGLVGGGISLIVVVGLIHLINSPGIWKKGPTRGCCTWPTSSARWRRRWASIGERGGAGPSDCWSPEERSQGT
jgi:hypothetical protein